MTTALPPKGHRPTLALLTAAATTLTLAACGQTPIGDAATAGAAAAPSASTAAGPQADAGVGEGEKETGALEPRLLMSHPGGLTLMDAGTGTVIADKTYPAFLRLNNAGDGRHVMVSDSDTFRVYDTGIYAQPHGDHDHNFTYTPGLTNVTFPAEHAGHVVLHNGRTVLFADGTGKIDAFDSAKITLPNKNAEQYATNAPHHGVAIELADGSVALTQGTEKERHTIQVKKDDKVVAETTDCPGVHGESMARPTDKGEVLAFGCENGPVVFRDGAFHKVPVKDAYSRSGNLFGHEESPIVLGDYKVDKDAEPVERPTRISLIDTRTDTLKLVDLKSPYWFRSFARGPEGEGLVLTYDGMLHVIDVESGKETGSVKVVEPWQEKADWQEPGPAVKVAGEKAYVADAATKKMHVVDLATTKVTNSYDLPADPVEYVVTTGRAEAPTHEEARAGHDH